MNATRQKIESLINAGQAFSAVSQLAESGGLEMELPITRTVLAKVRREGLRDRSGYAHSPRPR